MGLNVDVWRFERSEYPDHVITVITQVNLFRALVFLPNQPSFSQPLPAKLILGGKI